MYSGTPLIRMPMGQENCHFSEVSLFQQFWGKIAREKLPLLLEKRPY